LGTSIALLAHVKTCSGRLPVGQLGVAGDVIDRSMRVSPPKLSTTSCQRTTALSGAGSQMRHGTQYWRGHIGVPAARVADRSITLGVGKFSR
jgi:hypothetical protein